MRTYTRVHAALETWGACRFGGKSALGVIPPNWLAKSLGKKKEKNTKMNKMNKKIKK